MIQPKRVAAIHDLSCFGRCALTVILPILSSMGVQCCPVPTAVLSTHTGGYGKVVMKDIGSFVPECLKAWQSLNIKIDSVYSGFLANVEQIADVESFFKVYPKAFKVVDPVLGDNGKIYTTVTASLISEMKRLVSSADMITPNPTEAALLVGKEYKSAVTKKQATSLLIELSNFGPQKIVVTGINVENEGICNIGFCEKPFYIKCNYKGRSFPGTGDIFTSVTLGALLSGESFESALSKATVFVETAISFTDSENSREGIFIEPSLKTLYDETNKRKIFKL